MANQTSVEDMPRETLPQLGRTSEVPNQPAQGSQSLGFLRANNRAYGHLVAEVSRAATRNDTEATLKSVIRAARFASRFHPGRFADGAIENPVLSMGLQLADPALGAAANRPASIVSPRKPSRRVVMHVATGVFAVGGHTRMLKVWMTKDSNSIHWLVLTDQRQQPIPEWLTAAVCKSGGDLQALDSSSSWAQRAMELRRLARTFADLVVLHHGATDLVPTLAFATPGGPPVAVLNHADHLFWMGSSVTDFLINLRTADNAVPAARRGIPRSAVLPIPLEPLHSLGTRSQAREALAIQDDQVMLLSVARGVKYRPCGEHDFVATAGKLLTRHEQAHLYVVGATASELTPYLTEPVHPRLHFVGEMEDPSQYREAADIYLESFPFGSNTALLEAALTGLPVVPALRPLSPLLVARNDALDELIRACTTEDEYLGRVGALIEQPPLRLALAQEVQRQLRDHHIEEGWLQHLEHVYEQVQSLSHQPRSLPTTECLAHPADIGLSHWTAVTDGKIGHAKGQVHSPAGIWRHAAFVAKDVSDYRRAHFSAWHALWCDFGSLASWRLLAVTSFGPLGPYLRRMLARQKDRAQRTTTRRDLRPSAAPVGLAIRPGKNS